MYVLYSICYDMNVLIMLAFAFMHTYIMLYSYVFMLSFRAYPYVHMYISLFNKNLCRQNNILIL